jgi:hypothetical protein
MFASHGYTPWLVNEFKTSQLCSGQDDDGEPCLEVLDKGFGRRVNPKVRYASLTHQALEK